MKGNFFVLSGEKILEYKYYTGIKYANFLQMIKDKYSVEEEIKLELDNDDDKKVVIIIKRKYKFDELIEIVSKENLSLSKNKNDTYGRKFLYVIKARRYPTIYNILSSDFDKNFMNNIVKWYYNLKGFCDNNESFEKMYYSKCKLLNKDYVFKYDRHINLEDKKNILKELFNLMFMKKKSEVNLETLMSIVENVKIAKLENASTIIEEIDNRISVSKRIYNFFMELDVILNIGYFPTRKIVIVVNSLDGILANLEIGTGKIWYVLKSISKTNSTACFKRKYVNNVENFKVATPDDIYTYRESYYLDDGSCPFSRMELEEIKESFK